VTAAVPLVERLAEVLRMHVWDDAFGARTAHAAHHFHAYCAVCSGDVDSIARALLPVVEQAVAEARGKALREAADDFRNDASEAWGGDASWLTTGTRVANLAADWLDERANDE
jgi:hypothetical protein